MSNKGELKSLSRIDLRNDVSNTISSDMLVAATHLFILTNLLRSAIPASIFFNLFSNSSIFPGVGSGGETSKLDNNFRNRPILYKPSVADGVEAEDGNHPRSGSIIQSHHVKMCL